jgi:glutamate/aspartate transport system permease protein
MRAQLMRPGDVSSSHNTVSPLVYVIGLRDFLTAADLIGGRDGRLIEIYILAAVVFFLVCWAGSQAVGRIARRSAA